MLPRHMQLVHLFPGSKKVLLLLGQFCDAGMRIILTKYDLLEVMGDKSQEVVIQGSQSVIDGMWRANISNENETSDCTFQS